MADRIEDAKRLLAMGFWLFPIKTRGKTPAHTGWQEEATRDESVVLDWLSHGYNVGIFTSRFGDSNALLVVDVDIKGVKNGEAEMLRLEMEGKDFPPTLEQRTPTGGRHLIYTVPEPVRQGVDVLGLGLDIRAKGGYIVAAGSVLANGVYTINDAPIAPAPEWLAAACGRAPERNRDAVSIDLSRVDPNRATARAIEYLVNQAPESVKGQGGDQTAYRVAARVKDLGVSRDECLSLMLDHWFGGSGWSPEKLQAKIDHAYKYGQEPAGVAAPEAQFPPIEEPAPADVPDEELFYLDRINKSFAVIYIEGSHFILHETVDEKGRPHRVFMTEVAFKRKFSNRTVMVGKSTRTWAEAWLDWQGRREFTGVAFAPERPTRNGYYNLWRGFTCAPVAYEQANPTARRGFDMFMEHVEANICQGRKDHAQWLLGYFAHMIQRPWERPLTTLVFRGEKGVGKNAAIDRIGKLLGGGHYLVAHDGRYLTSNFNGHLDSCLCLVLDEAFWSGDKAAEGKLKGLTTASEILIERKGKEAYSVDNLVRLVVIGNEDWLVPASNDERRYGVFHVGNGKKQQRQFFHDMRVFIDDEGGNAVLLDYLLKFDLKTIDVNAAPITQALLDQKAASLSPFEQWWLECLTEGRIVTSDFGAEWPEIIECERFRNAFGRYLKDRNIRARAPDSRSIGKSVNKFLPSVKKSRSGVWRYVLPPLEQARAEWDKFMGQPGEWE